MFLIKSINNILYKIFIPKNTILLGRWKIKNNKEIEYYINKLHADPGYKLNRT